MVSGAWRWGVSQLSRVKSMGWYANRMGLAGACECTARHPAARTSTPPASTRAIFILVIEVLIIGRVPNDPPETWAVHGAARLPLRHILRVEGARISIADRKSTRLNSSHL